MVYITGDCHGDWSRFSSESFPEQKGMTRDDFVIVCGDFGLWNSDRSERWWLKWLSEKSLTLVFVDGNHENFDRLYGNEFETVDFHGGRAHRIRENVYHLMRGYIFDFCGKKFFAFGGASSHDIRDGILEPGDFSSWQALMREYNLRTAQGQMLRINHVSWWARELPSKEELELGLRTLEASGNRVDFIVSHCPPGRVAAALDFPGEDCLTRYFDRLVDSVRFTRWFFGHLHQNRVLPGGFVLLYEQIVRAV